MKLNDLKIKALKPRDKVYRELDGNGLYIEIKPNGKKYWRLRYRKQGKDTLLSLGEYPQITLKEARKEAVLLQDDLEHGKPKKTQGRRFSDVLTDVLEQKKSEWCEKVNKNRKALVEMYILPFFKDKKLTEITRQEVLQLVQPLTPVVSRSVLSLCNLAFEHAILAGDTEINPTTLIKKALKPLRHKPRAALLNPREVGQLYHDIKQYPTFAISQALQFLLLTFCRPGEVRNAEWKEFDFEGRIWTIPAEKMKMGKEHIVPLSSQAMQILKIMHNLTGGGKYVFTIKLDKPLATATFNKTLVYMGYPRKKVTPHGFRSTASTLLNELGYRFDVIEMQLAHAGHDRIRAIYNRAEYLQERRELMQAWADYLDELERSCNA